MGDQFTIKMKQFTDFELPFDIKTDDITVIYPQVHEAGLSDRFKDYLREALAKSNDLKEVGKYLKTKLEEKEDGVWFAGAWFDGMKSAQFW